MARLKASIHSGCPVALSPDDLWSSFFARAPAEQRVRTSAAVNG
jgi:hypothetical protein